MTATVQAEPRKRYRLEIRGNIARKHQVFSKYLKGRQNRFSGCEKETTHRSIAHKPKTKKPCSKKLRCLEEQPYLHWYEHH